MRVEQACANALGLIALALFVSQLYGQTEPVPVTIAIHSYADFFRLYVLPAVGTLLMGMVAILLEWIRRMLSRSNASTLVAATNAKAAATEAREGRELLEASAATHTEKLEAVHELVNGRADRAEVTIANLKAQLRQAGIEPQDG